MPNPSNEAGTNNANNEYAPRPRYPRRPRNDAGSNGFNTNNNGNNNGNNFNNNAGPNLNNSPASFNNNPNSPSFNNNSSNNNYNNTNSTNNNYDNNGAYDSRRPRRPRFPRRFRSTENRTPSTDTLFVANLPFSVDDDGLAKIFEGMNIKSAHVVRKQNQRSKGFGFVEFHSPDDQQKALSATDKKVIEARELSVKIALTEVPRNNNSAPNNGAAPSNTGAPANTAVPAEQK